MSHRGITVTHADEMADRLREDTAFVDCTFDGGSFSGLSTEALELTDCSLQDADFSHLVCGELRIARCDLQRAESLPRRHQGIAFHRLELRVGEVPKRQNEPLSPHRTSDFSLCSFDGASLFGADLTGSRFRAVELRHDEP